MDLLDMSANIILTRQINTTDVADGLLPAGVGVFLPEVFL